MAVLALSCKAVLEHHHRPHVVGPLEVAHVVALDPQRRLSHPERHAKRLDRPCPAVVVRRPAQAMLREVFRGVAGDGLHEGALGAAPWRTQHDRPATALREEGPVSVGVLGQLRDEHEARYSAHRQVSGSPRGGVPRPRGPSLRIDAAPRPPAALGPLGFCVGVELLEDAPHKLRAAQLLDLVHHECPATHYAAAPHMEHTNRRLERVVLHAYHVEVLRAFGDHLLALKRHVQRRELVAPTRGALEVEGLGRLLHLRSQPRLHFVGRAREERHEVLCQPLVVLVLHRFDARPRASLYVVEQARLLELLVALEFSI